MKKYQYKFKEFNYILKDLLSEEDTLDNIKTGFLNNKPDKKEKDLLKDAERWAKYAFDKDKEYFVTAYDFENKPIACINYLPNSISVKFLDYDETNKLESFITIIYSRRYPVEKGKEIEMKPYSKDIVFFKQIERTEESELSKKTEKIIFRFSKESDQKGKMVVKTFEIIRKPKFGGSNSEREAEVNLSRNWIPSPSHYLDFDHLLNYKEILKSEYLDIPVSDKE